METPEFLRGRIRFLFSRIKWPGLVAVIWGIFTLVPEWHHRIEFWLGAAQRVRGHMPQIAAIVTSQWFGIGLVVSGVGYLLFVGEPKGAVRHPLVPVLGWAVLGIVFLVWWSVVVAGYVAVNSVPSLPQVAEAIGKLSKREQITELIGGNTIVLQHDPVPETIYLILGHFSYRVADEKDCRLEGRKIILSDSREGDNKLSYTRKYLNDGDVKVEYWEQPE